MWQNMPYGYGGNYGWMHGGGSWLGFGLHSLIWILVIVAIVTVIIWAVRNSSRSAPHTRHEKTRPTALEILDERYARGEIDREEYQARKADLEG